MDENKYQSEQFTTAVKKLRDEFLDKVRSDFCNELSELLSKRQDDGGAILDDDGEIVDSFFTPIEARFFLELLWLVRIKKRIAGYISILDEILFDRDCIYIKCHSDHLRKRGYNDSIIIEINQQKIIKTEAGNYRVDFCFSAPCEDSENKIFLCVELDGHEFHEKSKEQAQRDKQRDRELQKSGYSVIHYTGSEVWKDTNKVVIDSFNHLMALLADKFYTLGLCQREEIKQPESMEPSPF